MNFILNLLFLFAALIEIGLSSPVEWDFSTISIPWPSGIVVDKVIDNEGRIHRFGRLQHNSVSTRPEWSETHLVEGFLTPDECNQIITMAEDKAARDGWSKGRHIDYDIRPTRDLPVGSIFEDQSKFDMFVQKIERFIWPLLARAYKVDEADLEIGDLFITNYNASRVEKSLAEHTDKSLWSFVVALNDEFTGGGTFFQDTSELWMVPKGGVLLFHGYRMHGGASIQSGVRYILAGFVDGFKGKMDRSGAPTLDGFLKYYNPLYDGHAAAAGFRTGDLIVRLQTCSLTLPSQPHCSAVATDLQPDSCNASTITNKLTGRLVYTTMTDIGFDMSDEEWLAAARSCEQLAPNSDMVVTVRRRVIT